MKKIYKINEYFIYILKVLTLFTIIIANNKTLANDFNNRNVHEIYDVNICESKKSILSVCIYLDKKYPIHLNLLNDPYRIILDFDGRLIFPNHNLMKWIAKDNLINKLRFGHPTTSKSRLVLELFEPAIVSKISYEKQINKNSIKLKIAINKTSKTGFSIAKHVLFKNKQSILDLNLIPKNVNDKSDTVPLKPEIKKKYVNSLQKNYIVFIDPGHGGKDPGAIGSLGTLEKEITLNASLKLANFLNKNKNITSILSRNTDIYLPLRKRVHLAKINKADIFISIHADASVNNKANGISVFSLSDTASDKEANLIAQRENSADIIPNLKTPINDPVIMGTLIKMFQRQAMNDSAHLAKKIISNLENTKLAVNRGHRFAGFSVLKSHEIPSILIEIGFLSNKKEEKQLLNEKYIYKLSKNLSRAIENYLLR